MVGISAPWATTAMVENYLDRLGVAELFDISSGVASLVGMMVPEKTKVAGQLIRDIDIPMDCVVAAVIRGKDFVVPRVDTQDRGGRSCGFCGAHFSNQEGTGYVYVERLTHSVFNITR